MSSLMSNTIEMQPFVLALKLATRMRIYTHTYRKTFSYSQVPERDFQPCNPHISRILQFAQEDISPSVISKLTFTVTRPFDAASIYIKM
jgi:inorganic pyrophosphatase/exopolyphosphatase